jgi:hypothetical protein
VVKYEDLIPAVSLVRRKLRERKLLPALKYEDLIPALLGTPIRVKDSLRNGLGRYADLVADGAVIRPTKGGSLEDPTTVPFVPTIPLLPLFFWAEKAALRSRSIKILYAFMTQRLAVVLKEKPGSCAYNAVRVEYPHALFLSLRILLKDPSKKLYLLTTDHLKTMTQLTDPLLVVKDVLRTRSDVLPKYIKKLATNSGTVVIHLGRQFPGTHILVFENQTGIRLSLHYVKSLPPTSTFCNAQLSKILELVRENWAPFGFTAHPLTKTTVVRAEVPPKPSTFLGLSVHHNLTHLNLWQRFLRKSKLQFGDG